VVHVRLAYLRYNLSSAHRVQLIDLSNVYLVSCYLSSILSWLVCNCLSLSMCLSLCCLIRNTSDLTHDSIDILWVLRWDYLGTNCLQSLATELPYTSGDTLCMMKMRYLNLMSIVKIARKSTVSDSIYISNLLDLGGWTRLYYFCIHLRYLLRRILLISTWFVS